MITSIMVTESDSQPPQEPHTQHQVFLKLIFNQIINC